MLNKGIWTSATKRYSHSTQEAGITHVPVLVTIDTPLLKDTYLDFGATTTNYGTNTTFLITQVGDSFDKRPLLKLDVSTVPTSVLLESASLVLNCSALSASPIFLDLYLILRSSWVETEATWNIYKTANNWTTAGAGSDGNDYQASPKLASTYTLSATGQQIIPFTLSEFNKFVSGTYPSTDMIIRSGGVGTATFSSLNHGTSNLRPFTRVTYYV